MKRTSWTWTLALILVLVFTFSTTVAVAAKATPKPTATPPASENTQAPASTLSEAETEATGLLGWMFKKIVTPSGVSFYDAEAIQRLAGVTVLINLEDVSKSSYLVDGISYPLELMEVAFEIREGKGYSDTSEIEWAMLENILTNPAYVRPEYLREDGTLEPKFATEVLSYWCSGEVTYKNGTLELKKPIKLNIELKGKPEGIPIKDFFKFYTVALTHSEELATRATVSNEKTT